jgi:predicted nucleic acid-binding protein
LIVLDASVAVEWLLGLPHADEIARRLAEASTVHVPHLLAVEATQVVRRYAAAGDVTADRAAEAIADLADLDVELHPHEPLLPAMWRLRAHLTAYDAAYVALASALDAPLVTLDRRLAVAPGLGIDVDIVG